MLQKVGRTLIEEVTVFEKKMVEMGFMDGSKASYAKDAALIEPRSVSFPTNLTVLVNHDNVDSPMNANTTQLTSLSVSSPPPALSQNKKKILSQNLHILSFKHMSKTNAPIS